MNMLDVPLRCEPRLEKFKAGLRDWVKKNISAKPKPKFQALGRVVIFIGSLSGFYILCIHPANI